MPTFGEASRAKLQSIHPDLRRVMWAAIKEIDFTIVWGYRGEADQNAAFKSGASKKQFPDSKHNKLPCLAVDIAPWPLMYTAHPLDFAFIAGIIMTVAKGVGVGLRWGGDWNKNLSTSDENFKDLGHFELG